MDFTYPLADFIDFRDPNELARVRAIEKEDICKHSNQDFDIRVIEEPGNFYAAFATDLVSRIKASLEAGEELTAIIPAGPIPQYQMAARMINSMGLSMKHVHFFAMDEYADDAGNTAPESWAGSFQSAIKGSFLAAVDEHLRPLESQVHFPTTDIIADYSAMLADRGGADVCYGGIGWCGHIAFWESHLGHEYDDLDAYKAAGARLVELHPMTVMQNALHSFSGDWSFVPPKANTIGPAEILGAKHRSFWLDGYLGGGVSWQRFIARLVAHGPVNKFVAGSLLQEVPTTFTMLGGVADNVVVQMA